MSDETVQQLVIKVLRLKGCKHATNGTKHCGNPRCRNFIGKKGTD